MKVNCLQVSDSVIDNGVINLQRGNEVDWDSEILNESDVDSAYVYYNELGVREILVNF